MEEVALRLRTVTAAAEYRVATGEPHAGYKADTWFYPVVQHSTMGFYDLVLGWNHAVILEPVGRGLYAVQWIFAYTSDKQHQVHGGIGVDVHEAGTTGAWTVYRPRQQPHRFRGVSRLPGMIALRNAASDCIHLGSTERGCERSPRSAPTAPRWQNSGMTSAWPEALRRLSPPSCRGLVLSRFVRCGLTTSRESS